MLRKKNLVQPTPEGKQLVADFFGLPVGEVVTEPQPETFSINIDGNDYAQSQYKSIAKYGNTGTPGGYNFKGRLLVRWNGKKVQPV